METLQQILGVVTVLGLLAASLWWLRRRGIAGIRGFSTRRPPGMLQAVDRLTLSATHTLHVVRFQDRAIVFAIWPTGCKVVDSVAWTDGPKAAGIAP